MAEFRWKLAEEEAGAQPALFRDDELVDRHVGTGEFRGMEFLHVNARRIVNEVPAASRVPFRYTINAYRGCSHACTYCQSPDTPVLMADGSHRPIGELVPGDEIYGTERVGGYRRYVRTSVLDRWETVQLAHRVVLADGTELLAGGDHRYLTGRGWKFVAGAMTGRHGRPYLTLDDELLGTGRLADQPEHCGEYRTGYLAGMTRGDGTSGQCRLPLADLDGLRRTRHFLGRREMAAGVATIERAIGWPRAPTAQWAKGFLAGIFDAEGSYIGGVLRIHTAEAEIVDASTDALRRLGFRFTIEAARGANVPFTVVRVLGGLSEHLRFFHTVDPAIAPKRSIEGQALNSEARLRVVAIERTGVAMPMVDISTGTGDFVADGVVSHNCFARPTHEYLGLGIGEDFDRKVVVKVNAVERLRAELASPHWGGDHIAMGTNTDPYQRCEGKYHLTQGIVTVLGEAGNPFSVLTKSTLILRDLDRLRSAAAQTSVRANFSIGTLDEEVWRATEPGTPHPRRRVEAVARLNEAGVPCGVLVAPVLPGLSDSPEQLEAVVDACVAAGAVTISAIALHLRAGVRDHFMSWLAGHRPDLVEDYERRYRRAYLPAAEQQHLADLVSELVRRARGRYEAPNSPRRYRAPEPEPEPASRPAPPPAPAAHQLELAI